MQDEIHKVNWNFPDSNKSDGLNSIHPYPAKFIHEIPRELIKILGVPQGSCVLDPFCGSGATLVEAQRAGYPAVGIDLNPIACLISRVKTSALPKETLSIALDVVQKAKMTELAAGVPDIPNLDHWFRRDIQEEVAQVLTEVNSIINPQIRDALRLAVSSILVRVSNQDSDTRYAAVEKKIKREDVQNFFLMAVDRIVAAKASDNSYAPGVTVLEKNILETSLTDIPYPVGLVITSPPYPNAYEYWLYHKYRMYWLGYNPQEVKQKEIGARAHYFKKHYPTIEDFRNQMLQLLNLLWCVIVPKGHVCIVIGRSQIHGMVYDNAKMITQVAKDIGFDIIAEIPREIAAARKSFNLSHAKIKTEHLLIFRKV